MSDHEACCRSPPPPPDVGPSLGLVAFDHKFNAHFEIKSDQIKAALAGTLDVDAETAARCKQLADVLDLPQYWGIRVRVILQLISFIGKDLHGYTSAHGLDDENSHVCYSTPCFWHHSARHVSLQEARGTVRGMRPNMKVVVDRYVKPWTQGYQAGLALVLNAGHMAARPDRTAKNLCLAEVFISHCWNESFFDFTETLRQALEISTRVWVCSLGICQHGDIGSALHSLESCPFAKAMQAAKQVLVVTDSSTEVFSRCWCILEADFALQWEKPYSMTLPKDDDEVLWSDVSRKLERLDVTTCSATVEADKQAILAHAAQNRGGVDALNRHVSSIASAAMVRAQMNAAARHGDAVRLKRAGTQELRAWRSIRGRTVCHILAVHSHVSLLREMLETIDYSHLDEPDAHGQTPLSVAAEVGALASVGALVSFRADVEVPDKHGLRPLHYATARGHEECARCLLEVGADPNPTAKYRGVYGYRPSLIASREGHTEILHSLLRHRADITCRLLGLSPIHLAARESQPNAVALLLAHSADASAAEVTELRRTPLMYAAESGCLAAVSLLVTFKAQISDKDAKGRTCSDYCLSGLASPEIAGGILDVLGGCADDRIKAGCYVGQDHDFVEHCDL